MSQKVNFSTKRMKAVEAYFASERTTIKKAMSIAGYNEHTYRNSSTRSKIKELISDVLEREIGTEYVVRKLKSLLLRDKRYSIQKASSGEIVERLHDDPVTTLRALEMYFKLVGAFKMSIPYHDPIDELDPKEIERELEKIRKLKERYNSGIPNRT